MKTQEKKRMLYVGLLVIFSGIIIGSFIDAYVTTKIIAPLGGNYQPWWPINGVILLTISGIGALASWWGDSHRQGREDKIGAALIFSSALILVWSGLSDVVSAIWQNVMMPNVFNELGGFNSYYWWWLDWGSLPHILSRVLGSSGTSFAFMILGSIIGAVTVSLLWYLYYNKA